VFLCKKSAVLTAAEVQAKLPKRTCGRVRRMPFDVLGKSGVKRAARQDGAALGGLYFLAGQFMDGFRRQKHDLPALIHCQQESGTGLLPAIHTGIAATADKDRSEERRVGKEGRTRSERNNRNTKTQ